MPRRYWLMKCEPAAYTIDELARDGAPAGRACATTRRAISCATRCRSATACFSTRRTPSPSGVTGLAEIARAGYPDPFAWKKGHKYFDAASTPDKPTWYTVDLKFVRALPGDRAARAAEADARPRDR